jgi:hypothetical protein
MELALFKKYGELDGYLVTLLLLLAIAANWEAVSLIVPGVVDIILSYEGKDAHKIHAFIPLVISMFIIPLLMALFYAIPKMKASSGNIIKMGRASMLLSLPLAVFALMEASMAFQKLQGQALFAILLLPLAVIMLIRESAAILSQNRNMERVFSARDITWKELLVSTAIFLVFLGGVYINAPLFLVAAAAVTFPPLIYNEPMDFDFLRIKL